MAGFFFKIGALYSIMYQEWKTNPNRIFIFVLFGNPVISKLHALNINARQLSTLDKAKLVHTIVRLSKIPNIATYSGALLYRIMLTYLRPQVRKCYRTYFHQFITGATLINYGLNNKEDFQNYDMRVYNPRLLEEAKRDFLVRILNMYSRRGVELKEVQDAFAKIQTKFPKPPPTGAEPSRVTEEPPYPEQPETPAENVPGEGIGNVVEKPGEEQASEEKTPGEGEEENK